MVYSYCWLAMTPRRIIPTASLTSNEWQVGPYHVGWEIPCQNTSDEFGMGWKTMSDGSIHPHRAANRGVEIVSPILRCADGIARVESMVARLRSMSAKVNSTCGMHVHVGWSGNARQLRKLISLVSHHEKALYASTGTKLREENRASTGAGSIKVRMKPYEDMRTMADLARGHHNRYQTLNLQNLLTHKRPTVEFRVFSGTLNIVKIKAYIQLCLALVQKAQSAKPKVKWDRTIKVSSAGRSNDTGSSAMNTLLMSLGWRQFHGSALETQKTYGMLTASEMPRMTKALKKMALKYDGPRP
jgi:hypothetical protein